ncbi:MAG: CapA family protein [Bacteroidetes bacterium]|nr:MAG: CapA family protein [Bacteroidota bacterium]
MKLFAIVCFLILVSYSSCTSQTEESVKKDAKKVFSDSIQTVTLTAVGDLMCHGMQYKYAFRADSNRYDFADVYEAVSEYLSAADLTMGNLETVLAGKTTDFSGYPQFNSPNEYADGVKKAGFDVLITSNNHSYDKGEAGILRTLEELQKRNLTPIGTYTSEKDRDSIRIVDLKGIKIALLAYTQFSNVGRPSSKKYLLNQIDSLVPVEKDILAARKKGAEIVLINYHWGNEYQREPNEYQRFIAKKTFELGADIVIGHHPHSLQPTQLIPKNKSNVGLDTGFIAYSLGNFYSNQRWRYSDAGAILTLKLSKNKNTGKITLKSEYVPVWVFRGVAGKRNRFIVLPSYAAYSDRFPNFLKHLIPSQMEFLTHQDKKLMLQADEDSRFTMTRYQVPLKLALWGKLPSSEYLSSPKSKFYSLHLDWKGVEIKK